ncbi:MSMEG_6728 family protein [Jiangella rhizosphaerae]|uniref:Cytoplasmic protein n=1 Tax=Jiangella rhizosphaerae TaxID=2293569 RepID=A0A418KP71_9ACTN|nr:MSMEG_6728 family protein [Jiangella rhizosphaerae]RIQ20736.1 cytoplasmic protein [Jiangella rhizosphaerae]
MQTFLPYPEFTASAAVLDQRRLGKQRVEALQVLRALVRPGYGWRHHPAASMWAGYEEALTRYGLDVCAQWCTLGHGDTCAATLRSDLAAATGIRNVRTQPELAAAGELPPWLGDEEFHRSHRSSLVRKDPEHYGRCFPNVPADLPYVWPASDRPRRHPVTAATAAPPPAP